MKAKLNEYRLKNAEFLGLKWQDKRNGEPEVYGPRFFATASDLADFLRETFGQATVKRVFSENVEVLP